MLKSKRVIMANLNLWRSKLNSLGYYVKSGMRDGMECGMEYGMDYETH